MANASNAASNTASTGGRTGQPLFVQRDIDGFFGLAIDNLIQFLLMITLCLGVLEFPKARVIGSVIPGAAVSVLAGNLFYAWQAQRLAKRTGRRDVTALPYGINTVSLFAYIFLVMLPVKLAAQESGANADTASLLAWRIGLAACLMSGCIELGGAFVADVIRRHTPRAALLSTLAGIAISFIALDYAVKTYEAPLVAMLPLAIILTTYFASINMPWRIPGGVWAIGVGSISAWTLYFLGAPTPVEVARVVDATNTLGFYLPIPVLGELVAGLTHPLFYKFLVPVMVPMGLFNVIGSLQNIESAEAAGDAYPCMPSLAVNGLGSIAAAVFGSCFPTTIYIGHPGWKDIGARAGYSILNGIFFTVVALFGLTYLMEALLPIEAGMGILLWIAIVITAQAFRATERAHAPAVALGLFPAIAAWGLLVLRQSIEAAGSALGRPDLAAVVLARPDAFTRAGLHLDGLVAISQGFMLTCMIWASISVTLIDHKFRRAAAWSLVGAVASFFGFIHAGEIGTAGAVYHIGWATGWPWAIGYALAASFFMLIHVWVVRYPAATAGRLHHTQTDRPQIPTSTAT